jgi:hypothetical protein
MDQLELAFDAGAEPPPSAAQLGLQLVELFYDLLGHSQLRVETRRLLG